MLGQEQSLGGLLVPALATACYHFSFQPLLLRTALVRLVAVSANSALPGW